MCEILVKAGSPAAFDVNDIVDVKPDGWNWGASELDTSLFEIVKFPGEPVSKYEGYIEELRDYSAIDSLMHDLELLALGSEELILEAPVKKTRKYMIINNKIVSK